MTDISDRVRIADIKVLSDNWYVLRKVTFSWRRNDGRWQDQEREAYDRGNGAAILLYNLAQRSVVLTRQFRMPAFMNGYRELLIEAAAGLLDDASPEDRIRAEAEEETGYSVQGVAKVFELFMSPGSVTEKLHLFVAAYDAREKTGAGGGIAGEGEDIDVLELPFAEALAMMADGRICDAKTVILLQYAQMNLFGGERA
ncbi:MAG TPA: NUDIX domain-containing protein [Rhizomicrobium sp.]|jgi:nudix-type nucleoside diphosphatase (YffH/AdpP family)|nr:NUDIX domain-containing protein [Rhizomicrobium sp.]